MDYEHFLKQVAEDLRYSIPGATVEISDVVKVQGESYGYLLMSSQHKAARHLHVVMTEFSIVIRKFE